MNKPIRPCLLSAALLLLALPLSAQERIDQSLPLSGSARVEVENLRGSITVRGVEGDGIKLGGVLGKGARGLQIEGDAQRLRIKVDYPDTGGGWGGWWGGSAQSDTELTIELPRGVELLAKVVSAALDVEGVDGPRLRLHSVSGGVRARSASAEVEVQSVSGDLDLFLEGARRADLQTVSGDLRLRGALAGPLKAETVSGDLDLQLDAPLKEARLNVVSGDIVFQGALDAGARLQANSLSGDLQLRLPAATSASLQIETFSGRIDSAVGSVEKEAQGPGASLRHRLGEGDADIRLESFSGDISLRLR